MLKYLLISFFLVTSFFCKGQEFTTIDRDAVEKAVTDAAATTYYPKLLERFHAFDTSLTNNEYRLLYYGFVFQKEYKGFGNQKKKEMVESINKKDYQKAISISNQVLDQIPISLIGNYYKATAMYLSSPQDSLFIQFARRYNKLMKAILSSGDGLTCKTAYKTIYVTDEYEILYQYFEIKSFRSQSLEFPCDRMRFEPAKPGDVSELYFDTSETLKAMQKSLKGD